MALALAKSRYLPTISATGSVSYQRDWSAGYTMGTYTAGLSVSLPIFEDGSLNAQVRQARVQLSSLRVQRSRERQAIAISVDNAIFGVLQSRRSLSLARLSVNAARQQYDLEKTRFSAGLATNLDVLQYSATLMSSESALEQARNGYTLAILGLDNALGL